MTRRNRIPGISKRTTKNGDVRWQAVVDVGNLSDRKQIRRTFDTQADAEHWRAEIKTRKRRGEVVEPSLMSLRDYHTEWMELKGATLRPSTTSSYAAAYRLLDPHIGDVALAHLLPSRISRAYAAISATYAPSTVRLSHRVLRRMLNAAMRDRLIPGNPAADVSPPGHEPPARSSWSIDTARRFLAVEGDNERYGDVWHLILETWLRNGEVRALRWVDVDLDQRELTIRRTAAKAGPGKKDIASVPKTLSSYRSIPFSAALAERLKTRRRSQQLTAIRFGEGWSDDRLVFPALNWSMMHNTTLGTALHKACQRVGIDPITVHDLRHTGGSIAFAAGMSIKTISERMGHSSVTITLNVYTHSDAEQHRSLADTMAELLTDVITA
jgi:integrase